MIRFECDYAEGALPEILEALVKTNFDQTPGYSTDIYCEKAREYIRQECCAPDADVHFLVGGTQVNKTVIQSILRAHQGALCASTGHINVHESGTIEAGGHKVLTVPSDDGKITAQQVKEYLHGHFTDPTMEHTVQPGIVYVSNPTENGTLYTKTELEAIRAVCDEYDIPLFLDGARMGYGLAAPDNDLTLADYARICNVFYIGATKVGALFGEAVVINDNRLKKDFRYHIKQNGGLLAKGRLLGVQFMTLFDERKLYHKVSQHAIGLAMKIRAGFEEAGCKFRYDSMTNQQFPVLETSLMEKLAEKYAFSFWEKYDENHTVVRFCTSWATKEENVDALIADLKELTK
ncbi:MAG: aminotransferase class I/II-fold pyridoxal phosphate-dependent enzyme [Oscillospiraceae bacterium]|nr:aminotransferase class I/II-fold pyridoxal phosphate-dependent enzyme [Oscillospiraceae bacterium]